MDPFGNHSFAEINLGKSKVKLHKIHGIVNKEAHSLLIEIIKILGMRLEIFKKMMLFKIQKAIYHQKKMKNMMKK